MSQTSTDDLGFDPDELRQRYRDERDKRVRAEANEQYTEIKASLLTISKTRTSSSKSVRRLLQKFRLPLLVVASAACWLQHDSMKQAYTISQ